MQRDAETPRRGRPQAQGSDRDSGTTPTTSLIRSRNSSRISATRLRTAQRKQSVEEAIAKRARGAQGQRHRRDQERPSTTLQAKFQEVSAELYKQGVRRSAGPQPGADSAEAPAPAEPKPRQERRRRRRRRRVRDGRRRQEEELTANAFNNRLRLRLCGSAGINVKNQPTQITDTNSPMANVNIKPLGDRVLVHPLEEKEVKEGRYHHSRYRQGKAPGRRSRRSRHRQTDEDGKKSSSSPSRRATRSSSPSTAAPKSKSTARTT